MISEGSCDTEDWSNDAENSALITGINLHFITHSNQKCLFWFVKIFSNFTVFIEFIDQINAASISRRGFFQKHTEWALL